MSEEIQLSKEDIQKEALYDKKYEIIKSAFNEFIKTLYKNNCIDLTNDKYLINVTRGYVGITVLNDYNSTFERFDYELDNNNDKELLEIYDKIYNDNNE